MSRHWLAAKNDCQSELYFLQQPPASVSFCQRRTSRYLQLLKRVSFFLYSFNRSWADFFRNLTKCLKNQPRDVIKIREMRGEVGKKTLKNEMDNPLFLWHFVRLHPCVTKSNHSRLSSYYLTQPKLKEAYNSLKWRM